MPGSARRLKKKLQEVTSPSPPATSSSTSPAGTAASPASPKSPKSPKSNSLSEGISNFLHPGSHPKSHSTGQYQNPPQGAGGAGVISNVPVQPVSSTQSAQSAVSAQSVDSVASDPGNYMTDEQLTQDLELEAMIDREKYIGNPPPPRQGLPPPPPLPLGSVGHSVSAPPQLPPSGSSSAPPPPAPAPAPVEPPKSGGMYGSGLFGGHGNGGGGKKKSSKQKFAERQARKKEALLNSAPPADPDWTAQLEKERQEEIQVIGDACEVLGREIYEISPDGHCMFNAISDQLYLLGLIPTHQAGDPRVIRQTAAQYMRDHKDDFIAFLPSPGGEDTADATSDGMLTDKGFLKYCRLVAETGEWGGEPEIQALSRAYRIPIHVIQRGPPTIVSHGGADDNFGGAMTPEKSLAQGERVVRISYHRRMYGLGEHYNSLRRV